MDFSLARQHFSQLVQQPEADIDLARAALCIAQETYPELDPEEYINALDVMADEVRERLPREPYPLKIIRTLNQYLFEDLKFSGNARHYYDPRNSFLNDVIDRRTGIPITLSLVYLEIAKRIEFPMAGVSFPGHFLMRPVLDEMEVLVDAFHQGELLFPEDCKDRLKQMYGETAQLRPSFLQPVSAKPFLVRLLSNLKVIYLNRQDLPNALAVIDRILLVDPDAGPELRDRGLLHYHAGRWAEARHDLMTYLRQHPDADDADSVLNLLDHIDTSS